MTRHCRSFGRTGAVPLLKMLGGMTLVRSEFTKIFRLDCFDSAIKGWAIRSRINAHRVFLSRAHFRDVSVPRAL